MARKNIMLGTAGHVDHGKTALVKLLTGCDTDRLAEEKRRGLTIELGFAPCRMADDRIVGIVDVPGHVSFIRHMVAGAHGVDVLILVVAADDGVMPQTREHLDVLTFMGARHGVIALTKIDMVDEPMRELAIQDVQQFVQGTFLADAPICPLSNITGEGFDGFFEALGQQVQACQPRVTHGPYRQWIERSFTAHGFGVVASGVPCAGRVQVGDSLRVLPGDRRGRVRYLQVYGENSDAAQAGECVAVNLADLDLDDTPRGVLLTDSPTLGLVQRCAVRLRLLGRLRRPIKEGAEVHLHVGTAHCQATLVPLEDSPLAPGVETLAQLRLDRPLPLAPGDRFVVRSHVEEGGLTTIGGGRVLDTTGRRFRRQRVETISPLLEREKTIDDPVLWCLTLLVEAAGPRTVQELAAAAYLLPDEAEANVLRLCEQGNVVALDSKRFVAQRTIDQTTQRIADYLKQAHQDHPEQLGVNAGELLEALACDAAVFDAAESDLIRRSMVVKQGELLAHQAQRGLEGAVLRHHVDHRLHEPTHPRLAQRNAVVEPQTDPVLLGHRRQHRAVKRLAACGHRDILGTHTLAQQRLDLLQHPARLRFLVGIRLHRHRRVDRSVTRQPLG